MAEATHHLAYGVAQVVECNALFREIDAFGAGSKAAHERQVAAVMSHDLDHVAALRGHSRFLNFIHICDDGIEGGICADGNLGAGQVVVDRRWDADDGHGKGRILMCMAGKLVGELVADPAADEH